MATKIRMLQNFQICLNGMSNTMFLHGKEYLLGDQGLTQRAIDIAIARGAAEQIKTSFFEKKTGRSAKTSSA